MANVKSQNKVSGYTVQNTFVGRVKGWLKNNRPQIFLVLIVGITMALYYYLTGTELFRKQFLPSYLHFLAVITGGILNAMGNTVNVAATVVQSNSFAMDIAYGCDALEPITLFTVVVAAFPAKIKARLLAIPIGILILFMINIIRLITLYYAGSSSLELFEMMHIEIWQPVFIVCALVLFIVYVGLVRKKGWSNV